MFGVGFFLLLLGMILLEMSRASSVRIALYLDSKQKRALISDGVSVQIVTIHTVIAGSFLPFFSRFT